MKLVMLIIHYKYLVMLILDLLNLSHSLIIIAQVLNSFISVKKNKFEKSKKLKMHLKKI